MCHSPNTLALADTLGSLGALYAERGQIDRAIEYTEQALRIHEKAVAEGQVQSERHVAHFKSQLRGMHDAQAQAHGPEDPPVRTTAPDAPAQAMAPSGPSMILLSTDSPQLLGLAICACGDGTHVMYTV